MPAPNPYESPDESAASAGLGASAGSGASTGTGASTAVPHIYLTAILLLIFASLFWYFADAGLVESGDGMSLTTSTQTDSTSMGDTTEVNYSVVDIRINILTVVIVAGVVILLANGLLYGLRNMSKRSEAM